MPEQEVGYIVSSFWGNSISTGYAMAFLFPITIWYAMIKKYHTYGFPSHNIYPWHNYSPNASGIFSNYSVFGSIVVFTSRFYMYKFVRISLYQIIKLFTVLFIILLLINPKTLSLINFYFNFFLIKP